MGDKPCSLVQFHFHSPAEHPVAGAVKPLEIHFVHQAADGERAVLCALVSVGRENAECGLLAESRQAIPISKHQLRELRETVEGNARPAQPLNGRLVVLF